MPLIDSFALIIGAMRSGTTSLFYYLSEHPEIAPAREKEPLFFCDDDKLGWGLDWYESLWDWNPSVHSYALEASSNYTMQPDWPNTAERIARYAGDRQFRFIYILRNPVKRIESHVSFLLSSGDLDPSYDTIPSSCIDYSRYSAQIQPYATLFGSDAIHLLTLESLQNDPQQELSKICYFLNIDPDYNFTRTHVSRNTRETLNMHPLIHLIRHTAVVDPVVNLIPPAVRQKLRRYLQRRDVASVSFSAQDQQQIESALQEDLTQLHNEYGIDAEEEWSFSL